MGWGGGGTDNLIQYKYERRLWYSVLKLLIIAISYNVPMN